jgi:uncharacterized protein YxeA
MPEENSEPPKTEPKVKKPAGKKVPESVISPRALPGSNPPEDTPKTEPQTAAPSDISPKGEDTSQAVTAPNDSANLEDTIVPDYTPPQVVKKSNKKVFIIAIIVIIVTIIAAVLFFTMFNKNKKTEEQNTETSQIQETKSQPDKEEKSDESFDRSKVTLEILNGSGVAGAAKKIADGLADLGYEIITVGNAPEESAQTQVLIAENLKKFEAEFLKDLNESLNEATVSGTLENSTASARITIGKNNF